MRTYYIKKLGRNGGLVLGTSCTPVHFDTEEAANRMVRCLEYTYTVKHGVGKNPEARHYKILTGETI